MNAQGTSAESHPDLQPEIAHLLLIDIVGFSKLFDNDQIELLEELNHIVRNTKRFQAAKAGGKFMRVPTGDGMTLVFFHSPEEPVRCAIEISSALREHPRIQLRMGVHSGQVNQVTDINDNISLTGSAINVAQRVLDCGDAGHILLSSHVAEDLGEYRHWQPHLRDLGECEVKHGLRLHLFNLCKDDLGNPQVPVKLKRKGRSKEPDAVRAISAPRWPKFLTPIALIVAALALVISFLIVSHRIVPSGTISVRGRSPSAVAAPALAKRVAVLPFENLSPEKGNPYFADGVQDEVLTYLAKIADLKTISRISVMQYKTGITRNLREIGQQLGVASVVEGSVQRAGNRVRVNARLVSTSTDSQLWGQTYERDLADVFAIQSEIAQAIAEQLQAKLSPREQRAIKRPPTNDISAFDLYTQAKNLLLTASASNTTQANLMQAADLLNQAVARDPSFFDAYCQLAYAHDELYFSGFDHTPARLASAEAAIQTASRLRSNAGETHLARAWNLYHGYLDYDGALTELEMARRTLPNDSRIFEATGYIERRQGRWEESTRNLERAIDLDPRNIDLLQQTSRSYQALRQYAKEKSILDRVLFIAPDDAITKALRAFVDFDSAANTRALHQTIDSIQATNPAAMPSIADDWLICALAERDAVAAENAIIASGEDAIIFGSGNVPFSRPFLQGVIARMIKDDNKARSAFTVARAEQEKVIEAQPNYGAAVCVLGLIDAGLGRREEALREGRRAVELLPMEKDAFGGAAMVKYFAVIAAWVGEKDLACQQLAIAVGHPSDLSYGQLKLLSFWDPLRGDPCFEKIVNSLGPR